MLYKNIKEEYEAIELKQLRSKNDKVMSKYIHLCQCNIGRSRQLVTFTVLSMYDKQKQLLKIKNIKNYFSKRLQNLKADIQYFAVIEVGKELNNPHLHFQLFYNQEDKERIKQAFLKTIKRFKLDNRRNIQLEETGAVSKTTSHNYVVKEFDNKKMTNNEVRAITMARRKLKQGNTKYIQFHSQSRSQNPHLLYKKMWFLYKMNYFQVNELIINYARRLNKEEFLDNRREGKLPYINFHIGMIEIDTLKLYNLIIFTCLYVFLSNKSSVKCIYWNKREEKQPLKTSSSKILYNFMINNMGGKIMSMSDLDIDRQEEESINSSHDLDFMIYQFDEAMVYIESFQYIVDNENEYADYVTATTKMEEYQNIVTLHTTNESLNEEVIHQIQTLQATIIELSHKLKATEENIPLNEKKQITVKDFEKLYSISDESQRKLRKRLSDPLPFIQIEKRGNVLYNPTEVDKWFENYTNEGK